jgi:Flp pilus assembly pilin Flp
MDLNYLEAWLRAKLHLIPSERGAGLVEYVLLVGLIAIVVISAVIFLQRRVTSSFSKTGNSLT